MVTKVYTGRISRYYPETRYFKPGTDIPAVVATPFTRYDFASEDDVPADGDWGDVDDAYIPDPLPEDQPEPSLMEQREDYYQSLALQAADAARAAAEAVIAAAAPPPPPLLPPPAPPLAAVSSAAAGAPPPDQAE